MVYNDTTNEQGILQDIDFTLNTNVFTFPIKDKTRLVNQSMDFFSGVIIGSDNNYQWDDTNYTNLPIGTTSLVSGQKVYTFDDEHLVLLGIKIKGTDGMWSDLKPIDISSDSEKLEDETTGIPMYFDKIGNTYSLYPTPNYSQSDSIKVYYQRKGQHFAVTDTTKEPGFASHLHKGITFYVAFHWALAKDPKAAANFKVVLDDYINQFKEHYSKRDKNHQIIITVRTPSSE